MANEACSTVDTSVGQCGHDLQVISTVESEFYGTNWHLWDSSPNQADFAACNQLIFKGKWRARRDSNSRPPGSKARLQRVGFLLISKLDGPPSSFVPLSAAESHQLPLKRYDIGMYRRRLPAARCSSNCNLPQTTHPSKLVDVRKKSNKINVDD